MSITTNPLPKPKYDTYFGEPALKDGPAFLTELRGVTLLVTTRYASSPMGDRTFITVWDPTARYLAYEMDAPWGLLDETEVRARCERIVERRRMLWHHVDGVQWYPAREPDGPPAFDTSQPSLDWNRSFDATITTIVGGRFSLKWRANALGGSGEYGSLRLYGRPYVAVGQAFRATTEPEVRGQGFDATTHRGARVKTVDVTYLDGLPDIAEAILPGVPGYTVPKPLPEYVHGQHPTEFEGVALVAVQVGPGCVPSHLLRPLAAGRLYWAVEDLGRPGRLGGYLIPAHLAHPGWVAKTGGPFDWTPQEWPTQAMLAEWCDGHDEGAR